MLLYVSAETVGLLGTGAHDGHLDFHTASERYIYIKLVLMIAIATYKSGI